MLHTRVKFFPAQFHFFLSPLLCSQTSICEGIMVYKGHVPSSYHSLSRSSFFSSTTPLFYEYKSRLHINCTISHLAKTNKKKKKNRAYNPQLPWSGPPSLIAVKPKFRALSFSQLILPLPRPTINIHGPSSAPPHCHRRIITRSRWSWSPRCSSYRIRTGTGAGTGTWTRGIDSPEACD